MMFIQATNGSMSNLKLYSALGMHIGGAFQQATPILKATEVQHILALSSKENNKHKHH